MKKLIYITCSVLTVAIFNLSIMSQSWNWYEDQLSYTRWGLTATTLDDTIFYSGGKNASATFTNIWDIYDIGEDQWDTVELSSEPRWNAVMISANGKVFCAGGSNYGGLENYTDVDIYDQETGEWTIDHLSLGRTFYYGSSITFGNEVWFAGGHRHMTVSGPMEYTNLIDIYNTETNTWTTDTLSVPRCFMGGVTAGGKVFFAGGVTGEQTVTNVIDIYDINTGEWSVDSLSEPRALVAAVAYDNKVYFAGGAKPNQTTSTIIDIYNIESETWDSTMNLQNSRIVTALKVKNSLVFTGMMDFVNLTGPISFGPLNGVVEIYYPEIDQWDYSIPNLNPPRRLYAFTSIGNKAYYGGGAASGYNPVSTISILADESYCLPEGITFTTQTQIDSFQINYPGCTEIEGDVSIGYLGANSDITNLNGLNALTSLGGCLIIFNNHNLTSLTGLDNVTSIGEGSTINIGEGLYIAANDLLTELTGLENLEYVEGTIYLGSSYSWWSGSCLVEDLQGLNNLTHIGGSLSLTDCDSLKNLTGLENLTTIEGSLGLTWCDSIIDLSGMDNLTFIGGAINVSGNIALSNLMGMENINSISYLWINNNNALTNLEGLNNLTSIGAFIWIHGNTSLNSLSALENLTSIGGDINIYSNPSLTNLDGLDNIVPGSIEDLEIWANGNLNNCDVQSICDYLAAPNGTIIISNNAPGCNSQQEVLDDCDSATSVSEMKLEESFTISPNPCSGYIKLRYTISDIRFLTFDIFDITCTKAKSIILEEKVPGTYEMEIDLNDLKPGIYVCVLKTPQYTETKKIIKLH